MKEVASLPFTNPLSAHPRRRYMVVERPDGNFSIAEQYFYQSSDESGRIYAEGWAPLPPEGGIYADAASAEREARRLINASRLTGAFAGEDETLSSPERF